MVRSILIGRQVPKVFWPEAARWCVHILNRCPTTVVQNKTPEEAWSGVKPTVDYFRVFGCITHVHIPDQHRVKLDDKNRQCVLLGVSDESKAYSLFDPVNKKVLISKDVIFEEQKGWNWKQNEEYQQGILDWGGDEEYMSDTEEQSEENVVDHNDDEEIEEQNEEDVVDSSIGTNSPPNNYETLVEGRVRRNRRESVWIIDYEKGEGLSNDVDLCNAGDDPISFEEAIKS